MTGPDLAGEFGPSRSAGETALRHNLPWQVTSFVGRADELAEHCWPAGQLTARSLTGCFCRSTRCDHTWSGSGTRPAPAAGPNWPATPLRPASTLLPPSAQDW